MEKKPWAASAANSRGRMVEEVSAKDRDSFQRDASRVIHSEAFRKLQFKTQVFANHESDRVRTRAIHSMEVAQVSRSAARELGLNEDLAETIALAHDLGHAPFGHRGQDVLNQLMREHGGFEHNYQALRVVDSLERPYLAFDGLNLLFESREGILKHCSAKNAQKTGELGRRFLERTSPSLEAQVVNLCDELAYMHADIEDGCAQGVLKPEEVAESLPAFKDACGKARDGAAKSRTADLKKRPFGPGVVKVATGIMLKEGLSDLIRQTQANIEEAGIKTIEDVRAREKGLARFSPMYMEKRLAVRKLLREMLYEHVDVEAVRMQQQAALENIFRAYEKNPKALPVFNSKSPISPERQICDYIASLTDREAHAEFHRVMDHNQRLDAKRRIAGS